MRARDPRGRRGRRSSRSRWRSSTARSTRAGSSRARRRSRPAAPSPSSAPGPAGLAAAQQLRRAGHAVTVYERDEAGGGLIRFGVPDFKIEKWVVERRLAQLEAEGVEFRYGVDVGADVDAAELRAAHDAVVIATGSRVPRDLPVPGRELDGVHYAMEYLYDRARVLAGADARRPHQRRGQARAGGRRRRHGRRLRRPRPPRGRRLGDADRAARRAARHAPRRPHAVAALAREAAHLLRAQGGRGARLRDLHHEAERQRPRTAGALGPELRPRRRSTRSPAPTRRARSISCCWRWASCTPSSRCWRRSAWRPTRAATPRPAPTRPRPTACSPRATPAAGSR